MAAELDYTNGPIVACDNAIQHYSKAHEQQVQETDKLRRSLAASLDRERMLDGLLTQWVNARDTLEHRAIADRKADAVEGN